MYVYILYTILMVFRIHIYYYLFLLLHILICPIVFVYTSKSIMTMLFILNGGMQ